MIKPFLLLLFAILLVIEINSTAIKSIKPKPIIASPFALIDEAQVEVDQLREITNAAIQKAVDDLDDIVTAAANDRFTILYNGELAIDEAFEKIGTDLTNIKNYADSWGKNVSSCVDGREDYLINVLPGVYIGQISDCMTSPYVSLNNIVNDARYYVEVTINKVNDLEFQLGRCDSDSILCISPVVTQIEQQEVQLPQQIQVEVDKIGDFLDGFKLEISACGSDNVSAAVLAGNVILEGIEECINRIIG